MSQWAWDEPYLYLHYQHNFKSALFPSQWCPNLEGNLDVTLVAWITVPLFKNELYALTWSYIQGILSELQNNMYYPFDLLK